jgi:hypothetical protein
VVRFYNQRGTAERHIKEGKYAFCWTRLSCRNFRGNDVRLQLKLIKIGTSVVRHARGITFQLAEVAVTSPMARAIRRLRAPPSCA